MTAPLVSILLPMLDEAEYIEACLRGILEQDHPLDRLEVVVVDGGSVDDSVDRAERALDAASLASWAVLHNPARTTPTSLNLGLQDAAGSIVCRVDARTMVQADHVRRCVQRLEGDPGIAVVGGSQVAVPRDVGARAQGIVRALNNDLSMGGAAYRSGGPSGPTDTVYLGAFRAADLRAAGGWDERFATNQDFELNRRLGRTGVVWFDAEISSGYVPRASLTDLWKQYHRFGRWKVRYWRTSGDPPVRRQRVILALPLGPVVLAAWLLARRSSVLPASAALGVLALVVIDARGAGGRPSLAVRAWGVAAMLTVAAAWWCGVVREAVLRRTSLC